MHQFDEMDLRRNTSIVLDAALREPVAISQQGRARFILLDIVEYERLKGRDKQVVALEEFPEEFIAALREPYFDEEQVALDHLLTK